MKKEIKKIKKSQLIWLSIERKIIPSRTYLTTIITNRRINGKKWI
jgi:hypothetical protein